MIWRYLALRRGKQGYSRREAFQIVWRLQFGRRREIAALIGKDES